MSLNAFSASLSGNQKSYTLMQRNWLLMNKRVKCNHFQPNVHLLNFQHISYHIWLFLIRLNSVKIQFKIGSYCLPTHIIGFICVFDNLFLYRNRKFWPNFTDRERYAIKCDHQKSTLWLLQWIQHIKSRNIRESLFITNQYKNYSEQLL